MTDEFGKYIGATRRALGIGISQLACGVCSTSMLSRIESGERYPDKMLRDRLLGRLGIAGYDYECYLNADEYEAWKMRMSILDLIREGKFEEVRKRLDRLSISDSDKIMRQFYLFAVSQILKQENVHDRLGKIFQEALLLTVPDISSGIGNLVLSVQELSLIMDFEYYNKMSECIDIYEAVLKYIERPYFDIFNRAMIYPKAVIYLFRSIFTDGNEHGGKADIYMYMLGLCDKAINYLRDTKRAYYLLELLKIRKKLYGLLLEENILDITKKHVGDNEHLIEVIESAYNIADIPITMEDDTYLYKEYEVYCVADVISRRRRTLGLTRKQLAEGIINVKSLIKIENKKVNPHTETVKELFRRLNLPSEHSRLEIITDSVEAKDIIRELRKSCNELDYERGRQLLDRLKKIVSMDFPVNRQYILMKEGWILLGLGMIDKNEYLHMVKEALECTISFIHIKTTQALFLSNEEILCIHEIKLNGNEKEQLELCDFLDGLCCNYECQEITKTHYRLYKFMLANSANVRGNYNEYDKSNEMSLKCIRSCMYSNDLSYLNNCFYNIAWNCRKQSFLQVTPIISKRYAEYALWLSEFLKSERRMKFYEKQIEDWKKEDKNIKEGQLNVN